MYYIMTLSRYYCMSSNGRPLFSPFCHLPSPCAGSRWGKGPSPFLFCLWWFGTEWSCPSERVAEKTAPGLPQTVGMPVRGVWSWSCRAIDNMLCCKSHLNNIHAVKERPLRKSHFINLSHCKMPGCLFGSWFHDQLVHIKPNWWNSTG